MDRAIVLCVLLLVGVTWLLYKLTILLEPRAEPGAKNADANTPSSPAPGNGSGRQKLIHERLRK